MRRCRCAAGSGCSGSSRRPSAARPARSAPRRRGSARSSWARSRLVLWGLEVAVDQLDAVAVGIGDEADPVLGPAARVVRRPLRCDALRGEALEQAVEVLGRDRDVAVAAAEVVGVPAALVDGQLERVPVAGESEVDVVGAVELEPAAALEAERLVEAQRGVDVADADIGVYELQATSFTTAGRGIILARCRSWRALTRTCCATRSPPRRA